MNGKNKPRITSFFFGAEEEDDDHMVMEGKTNNKQERGRGNKGKSEYACCCFQGTEKKQR